MAVDIDEPVAQRVTQLTHHRTQPPAERTQIIAVEDDAYGISRSRIAANMVMLRVDAVSQPQSIWSCFARHQSILLKLGRA